MDTMDIVLRLAVAAFAGVALGLNRDLRGKPTGVRTLGLVGLATAAVVLAVGGTDDAAASRVIQGIVTGIGFLGAGVIIRNETRQARSRPDHGGLRLDHRMHRCRLRHGRLACDCR